MSPTRRTSLIAAGSAATALLAGCLSTFETDDGDTDDGDTDDTDDEEANDEPSPETDGDETNDDDESGPEAAVEAFLEAAASEDTDAIAEAAHSDSFLNPAVHEESDFEYQFGSANASETDRDLETDVQTADASIDDVLDLEGVAFVLDEETLEDDIGDEEIALVRTEVTFRDPEMNGALVTATTVWIVATDTGSEPDADDSQWSVYWAIEREETIDDLEAAFEAPIIDEDDDVVAEIDWEYDQSQSRNADGEEVEWDVEWAKVVLTDSPGRDAETVRIESTIEGSEFELFGEGSNAWARSWVAVSLNPDGDQIVVTAVDDGEETVVHREQYEP